MKKLFSMFIVLLFSVTIISLPASGQSKRIGEIIEMSGMSATFSKNQPRGTIVLDENALELWYLFNYTPSGTTLGAASKVKISADALNGIYSGSDTIPNGTVAYVGDVMTFNGQLTIDGIGSTTATKGFQINSGAGANFIVNDAGEVRSRLGYWIDGDRYLHNTGSTGNVPVFLGKNAGSSSTSSVFGSVGMGHSSLSSLSSGTNITAVGYFSLYNNTGGSKLVGIGSLNTVHSISSSADVCLLGHGVSSTSNNQFVTGSSSSPYINYYFGRGVQQTLAALGSDGVSLNATSIQSGQTNASASGFPFSINASQGTGTGVGGDILFKFAPAGISGSTQNSLQTAMQITPTTERVITHYTHQFNYGINFNNEGSTWAYTEMEIGQWDMDATDSVLVAHPLVNWQSIRDVSIIIKNDADDRYYTLENYNKNNRNGFDANYFYLYREAASFFDNTNFNDVIAGGGGEYNRGYITFWYKI